MSEFYRKEDVDAIVSQMRAVAEEAFFEAGRDPGEENWWLRGYGTAIGGFVERLGRIEEQKPLKVVK